MSEVQVGRAWWKRRPWQMAAAIWFALPLLYALSVGPALYFRYDGRLPKGVYAVAYGPLWRVYRAVDPPPSEPFIRYAEWWSELAARRAGDRDWEWVGR